MWPFVENLSAELVKQNYEVHILDHEQHILVNYNKNSSQQLIKFLPSIVPYTRSFYRLFLLKQIDKKYKHIFSKLTGKYDVTFILYHFDKLNKYANLISKTSNRLVISYAGSDFLNVSDSIKEENRQLLDEAHTIAFNNPYMKEDFIKHYDNYREKIKITGFGLSNLSIIAKLKKQESLFKTKTLLSIPTNKIVISVGYTGDERHRHLDFFKLIKDVPKIIKDRLFFIMPMTYINSDTYIKRVSQEAEKQSLSYKIFDKRLSDNDICRIRLATDIAIHIASMDQSSASMLEHIFSGNVVIAGNWLPYKFWDDLGIYSHRIKEDNLLDTLLFVLNNLDEERTKSQQNEKIISNSYSWEARIKKWVDVL